MHSTDFVCVLLYLYPSQAATAECQVRGVQPADARRLQHGSGYYQENEEAGREGIGWLGNANMLTLQSIIGTVTYMLGMVSCCFRHCWGENKGERDDVCAGGLFCV